MRAVHLSLPYTERTDNSTFDYSVYCEEKETSITSCNSLSTFAKIIGASRRFVLAERVRGSYTGSAQSEERFGRNPCKKTRFSGALLSSENWLMQGEMADLQSGVGGRSTPRNGPEGSVPCCVLKRRLARGAALPCCVLKRSTGAIVRPRTCAKNRVAPGN